MNIFVAKLNYQTTEDQLRDLFEGYGEVDSVKIIFDKFSSFNATMPITRSYH